MNRQSDADQRIVDRLNAELSSIAIPARVAPRDAPSPGLRTAALLTAALAVLILAIGGFRTLREIPSASSSPTAAESTQPGARVPCPVTRQRDSSGVIVSPSGELGLLEIGPTSLGGERQIVLLWRGAKLGDSLELVAAPLDPVGRGTVMWSTPATPRATAWGDVVFDANSKPIFNAGCWRLTRSGADDPGIVIDLGSIIPGTPIPGQFAGLIYNEPVRASDGWHFTGTVRGGPTPLSNVRVEIDFPDGSQISTLVAATLAPGESATFELVTQRADIAGWSPRVRWTFRQ